MRAVLLALAAAFAGPAFAAGITVSAAASLTDAFAQIGRAFEALNPGVRVDLNFAASGALLQQMANGAPVDVFASADEATMDDAERRDLVDRATRVDFARNALVVVVPTDARIAPQSLVDLVPFRRVAIGQPASVPVGRYAKAVLEDAGLWSAIAPHAIAAQSVRQALDYVARGEVDAGFVYATDAAAVPDRVRVAFAVPTARPIVYPAAVLKNAGDVALARRFVAFLSSPAAQAVLAKHGFARP